MANIMITNVCNLNCQYCFANEFVNINGENHIELSAFQKAVDFILTGDEEEHIGLIGGEPTLHPEFKAILRYLRGNDKVKEVIVFTNGLKIDAFFEELQDEKFDMLINVNNPDVIGKQRFEKIRSNIAKYMSLPNMRKRISLGLNLYDEALTYDYIFDLIDEFEFKELRLSVVVPNETPQGGFAPLEYFEKMKPAALSVIRQCLKRGVVPYYDCNKLPLCILSNEERLELTQLFGDKKYSNILYDKVNCNPVIDILQDLTAVRCFGLSDYLNVDIDCFSSIDDLRRFFENEIDVFAHKAIHSPKCKDCYERNCQKCNGGCLAYKIDNIHRISEFADDLTEKGE